MTPFQIEKIDARFEDAHFVRPLLVYEPWKYLLDWPQEWVIEEFQEYKTSLTNVEKLQSFANYLATRAVGKFGEEKKLVRFWEYVMISDLDAWVTYRVEKKFREKRVSPKPSTVNSDAKVITRFMDWIKKKQVVCRWDGGKKAVLRAEKAEHMLKGMVAPKFKETSSYRPGVSQMRDSNDPRQHRVSPSAISKKSQSSTNEYLANDNVKIMINHFPDEVFKFISCTTYITGLRDFEVLSVPRLREDCLFTAVPSEIRKLIAGGDENLVLQVTGKGKKKRPVKFAAKAWCQIMTKWMPIFEARAKLYKEKYKEDVPLEILWLNKIGDPIFADPLDDTTHKNETKKLINAVAYIARDERCKGGILEPLFGHKLDFYCLRHSFATNRVLKIMEETENDKEGNVVNKKMPDYYILNASLRRDLADQMGHDEITTTFAHYVDNAVIIKRNRDGKITTPSFPEIELILE